MAERLQKIDKSLANIHEALDLYNFTELERDIGTLDDVRYYIRDLFLHDDIPFPWEELAALAVIGTAKKL